MALAAMVVFLNEGEKLCAPLLTKESGGGMLKYIR